MTKAREGLSKCSYSPEPESNRKLDMPMMLGNSQKRSTQEAKRSKEPDRKPYLASDLMV